MEKHGLESTTHDVGPVSAEGLDRAKHTQSTMIVEQAQRQLQTFFDELKNGTRNYRTVASLSGQVAQEYRGRCILELLQNAHDALAKANPGDPRRISFVLRTSPDPILLIGNSGSPFRREDFDGICQLGQSPKDPNESVGNKGLGFRSVLEVCTCPEIWSTPHARGDTAFVFRFDPAVSETVAAAAKELEQRGLAAQSPFDPERALVDWSSEHLEKYLERLSTAGIDAGHEARVFLSPYLLPLPVEESVSEVDKLLGEGHATVIRLRLDGGQTGTGADAVRSVTEQLEALDARSTVFLLHLKTLVIEIDGERRTLERLVDSDVEFGVGLRTRQQRILVGRSGPGRNDNTTRQFRAWTRTVGGDDDPEQAKQIRAAVEHLPNRWPEVRRVVVGVAVEEASVPEDGVFVIFLPTEVTTGGAAHINAPFYGSLSRRQIDFDDIYNDLLLETVMDLSLDVVAELVTGPADDWRARTVVDLISSTSAVGGKAWQLVDRLQERANACDRPLHQLPLVLCDRGWRLPGVARTMPDVPDDSPIESERWRVHAKFDVVSTVLDGRLPAVEQLVTKLGGSPTPTHSEWIRTIEHVATAVQRRDIEATWDGFLGSLVTVLPTQLRSFPKAGAEDPLAKAKFLPTQDGRLLSASDTATLFFQPVRGADDAADLVGDVPEALEQRVAFLHPDVRTQEGPQRRNTAAQKFLDERFAHGFRREDLLRDVVLAALPSLPAAHGTADADLCAELLSWALKLLGKDEPETLLPLFGLLPVPCHGGWYAMREAVFGPGWEGRLGNLLWTLADELPRVPAARLRETALLPPGDRRWATPVEDRTELFVRAGVVDGLRPQPAPDIRFYTQGQGNHQLPETPPPGVPRDAWDRWRSAVRSEAAPQYAGRFEYALSKIWLLPELHHLPTLSRKACDALSRLVLTSFGHWPAGWDRVNLSKVDGNPWSAWVTSPLKYWLLTESWLRDRADVERPISCRWLVPESLLLGQADRFAHLDPLSIELARTLLNDPDLKAALMNLGLNVYPLEDARIGPELLDALAKAWCGRRVSAGRFDVFLGQVRDGWRHLDPEKGLPSTFLVRTGRRSFTACGPDELVDVYLPDHRDRTRSLHEHGKRVLEMHAADAALVADALMDGTPVRRASTLEERVLIDGARWAGMAEAIPPLDETRYAWLPVVLLTIAAHGGNRPAGAATQAWRDAANRLRRAHVLECETIDVQLVDEDRVVAYSEPDAQWLPGDVLAVRRAAASSYESLAAAAQAMLDRQDLLKDLRLVLGPLSGQEEPTPEQIEAALDRAEIDAQALADVRHRWAGATSMLVDRIRPVLAVLGIPADGLEAAATDAEHLAEWVSENVEQWPANDLLATARRSRDDRAMGEAAWRTLGDVAQLPAWNRALAELGDRYVPVQNRRADEQAATHLEEVTPFLRAFARHVAIAADDPELFRGLEAVTQNFVVPAEWADRWWEVPVEAVIDMLCDGYAQLPGVEHHLHILAGVKGIDDLSAAFEAAGVVTEPNPYETASLNKAALESMVSRLHDLHRAWVELRDSDAVASEPPDPMSEINAVAYLYLWTELQLLERALRVIDDPDFIGACSECTSPEGIRERLGLDPEVVDAHRQERLRKQREADRKRRTFDVAGAPFEVGTASYQDLFDRLNGLPAPEGPRASQDAFSPLADAHPGGGGSGGGGGGTDKTSHQRPPPELRELVGVVGEMHAYRFLRAEFGTDVVTRDAWVSKLRLKVMPPVPGEPDSTSDSHGYDFGFRQGRKVWHVEVKATQGDDRQFDLGISEIKAASRLAGDRKRPWRILRVRNALSKQPTFEWLPNPLEEGFRKLFRLRRAGMTVSYKRKKC